MEKASKNQKKKHLYFIRGYYYNAKLRIYKIIDDALEATSVEEAKKIALEFFSKIGRAKITSVLSVEDYEYIYGPPM